jgi:hypothetical protein
MAYLVDRVVICDAFREPDKHYQLLPGGRSRLKDGRRSSVRFLASAKDVQGGISAVVGREATLFEDLLIQGEQMNDFINNLRDEVRDWREAGYLGTAPSRAAYSSGGSSATKNAVLSDGGSSSASRRR